MEPYNNRREPGRDNWRGVQSGGMHAFVPGLILVGIGALFLLDNLHILRANSWLAYWPVILIAVGLVKLVDSTYSGGRILGAVLMAAGSILLADNLGYINFNVWDLWPLVLIGAGLMMLWNRTHGGGDYWGSRNFAGIGMGPLRSQGGDRSNVVREFALFGGSKRIVTTPAFQGGHISVVFGGVNLDLTGAGMTNSSAVLDISTLYGGAKVRIPANWNAEVRGIGIFGGFSDHTIHPLAGPDTKRLIVRGAAIFGGVVIKN